MAFLRSRAGLLAVLLTAALLPALAALQYRWLGDLSELESRRMRSNLHWATEQFCADFDGDLTRIHAAFQSQRIGETTEAERKLGEAYSGWVASAAYPDLVKAVHWITRERGTRLRIQELDLSTRKLKDSQWPDGLVPLEDDLATLWEHRGDEYPEGEQPSSALPEEGMEEHEETEERRHGDSEPSAGNIDPLLPDVPALLLCGDGKSSGCTVVTVDRDVIVQRLFPERLREYFATGDELDYDVLVVDALRPSQVVYRSAPGLSSEDFAGADEEHDLFGLRLRGRHPDSEGTRRWRLLVRHPAGSLEAAVTATRLRNLAVSFGALLLLGASMAMLIVTTRRAHALARQQVEFVGGVSHELRTPLAGISSLSENLADGIVPNLERAREYGQAIHRESLRLRDMLERVFLFSRLESGRSYELRPSDPVQAIDGAIESTRSWVTEKAITVTKEIPEGLPPVLAEPEALQVAIQNILVNAVKFSPEGGVVRIRAAPVETGTAREVHLSVEDQGCGIPASEIPHVFEPFFRGIQARQRQIEGSGLGLSIVKRILEAQGGIIHLKSEPGRGTTVTVVLRVAEPVEGIVAHDTSV